jgi:Icc-related predicted phosphoesterase
MFYNISNRYLERELSKPWEGKTVVVTHHAPHPSLSMDSYPLEAVRFAYATDMGHIMREKDIDLWIFGHVHRSFDTTLEGIRVISNPLGYYNEYQKQEFDPALVVEI